MQAIRDRAMELAIEQAADRTLDKCKKMAKNDPPPDNPDQYMLDIFFEVRAFKVLPARLVYIDPETKKPKSWSPAYGIAKDFEETSKLLKAVEAANELLKPLRAIHGDLPAAELWAKRDEVPPPERAAKKKSKAPVVPPGTSTADGDKKSKASGD
jgi:hypothetical protein